MAEDIQALQETLRSEGHSWRAEATELSSLSEEQQKQRLGLQVTEAELQAAGRAISAAEQASAAARELRALEAPTSVDWRSNGGDWTTPIKDQKSCGSCVAFGTAASIESRVKLACKSAAINPDLSEAHLFYCGCGNCCGTGWNFAPALDFAKNTGVAEEAAFPYTDTNQPCKAGLTPYVKITGWRQVLSVDDRKSILASRGPVVGGLAVYSDFFAYAGGVYRKTKSATLRGYHAVSVVGYSDTDKCWICKNSWGPGWGEVGPGGTRGWFRMGYGEAGMDTNFAFYDIDVTCPPPKPDDCARYVPYLTQVIRAARVNAALRACLLYHVCGVGRQPVCSPAIMAVVARVRSILTLCPKYRATFCRSIIG